jgi:hypothetical protein
VLIRIRPLRLSELLQYLQNIDWLNGHLDGTPLESDNIETTGVLRIKPTPCIKLLAGKL